MGTVPLLDQAWLAVALTDPRRRAHREAVWRALPESVAQFASSASENDCPNATRAPPACVHACVHGHTHTN